MDSLTAQERILFRFIFNEKRVYQRWYGRWLAFGADYGRIRRVVGRVHDWREWCDVWSREGALVEHMADAARERGELASAKSLYHQAVACYHIGQHLFFIDPSRKEATQANARQCYERAIALSVDADRPIRLDIPFEDVEIPAYLHLADGENAPLVIYVNGMDNIKEAENHFFARRLVESGISVFTFDGPGQGEMWRSRKFGPDYHRAVSAIIDWLTAHRSDYDIRLDRIATVGFSLGGYLAPVAAANDRRVCCTVGNSGIANLGGYEGVRRLNPIWRRGIAYMTGTDDLEEAARRFDIDIGKAPALECPFLFFHAGRDEVVPTPRRQADAMMDWAIGEKELRYYPEGEHCTANYLDEVFPAIVDWLVRHLVDDAGSSEHRRCGRERVAT